MTKQEFIKEFISINNMTPNDTKGLYDADESSHDNYLENLEVSFVDNYAREKGITWDEANQILLDNI